LHDKGAFERLVTELGLPIPETLLVTSDEQLRQAAERLERYFARGVFSRGGVCCLTTAGPLAGALEMDEVHPTPASPPLVQPFLDGETVCTYSTAHQGRVSSHLMYRIPRQRKHSTGIQFEAVDATESPKADRADRGRAGLHRPDLLRLPGHRGRPHIRGVQPPRHPTACC
jgi:hypothetical protein